MMRIYLAMEFPPVEELTRHIEAMGVSIPQAKSYASGAKSKENSTAYKTLVSIVQVLQQANVFGTSVDKSIGLRYMDIATGLVDPSLKHLRGFLIDYVKQGKLTSGAQIKEAVAYLKKHHVQDMELNVDIQAFEEASGVGVCITDEQIRDAVTAVIQENASMLQKDRYQVKPAVFLSKVKGMKWADKKQLREEIDRQFVSFLGPKTEADNAPVTKVRNKKKHVAPTSKPENTPSNVASSKAKLFKDPSHNTQATEALLQKHLKATGGRVMTRFPPEPNGYLHIGHAKAMNLNFSYAKSVDGACYLRFDDTNPDAECKEYIDGIIDNVAWLGHTPCQITHASDYFDELYALGVELIKRGKAYVCHQTSEEVSACRASHTPSPWRERPIEESLHLFEEMRQGNVKEGEACLRMKQDMTSDNPCMWDLIAFRVKHTPHPRSGDKWKVYPSYDFTHCVQDSLENITHSLCTLEFRLRRESYMWLLDALELYRPVVWEYSRLNITHNMLSKRKLNALVMSGHVRGWDDPRLLTLVGLKRRGYTPASINAFCDEVGVSLTEQLVPYQLLEFFIRLELDSTAPRAFAVLDPLRLVLENVDDDYSEHISAPNHPKQESMGTRTLPLGKTVYIDASDFRTTDVKNYYGLAPGKSVILRYARPITCTGFEYEDGTRVNVGEDAKLCPDKKVVCVYANYDLNRTIGKCKGVLTWISSFAGVALNTAEFRLYNTLFKSPTPAAVDDWVADLNPESEVIVKKVLMDCNLANAKPGDHFQVERVGYFCCDPDTDAQENVHVFNRTCILRDSVPEFD